VSDRDALQAERDRLAAQLADANLQARSAAAQNEQLRTQLGDARSFSLDSPKSRVPRIEALRKG